MCHRGGGIKFNRSFELPLGILPVSIILCDDACQYRANFKYAYWAIRPNQLDPSITTLFPNPNHPSYPSAHAALSGAQAVMLAYLFPRDAEFFRRLAEEAGESRLWAGIHYRSDLLAGFAQADAVAQWIIELAENDGSQ